MLLAFDGHCVMCNGFVRFLLRHDQNGKLRFTASDTAAGAEIFAWHGQDPKTPASVILVDGRQAYFESDAILLAIAELGSGWRLVRIARLVPAVLRDALYRLIARNRYRLFGRLDHCPIPDPQFANRFVA